MKKTIFYLLLTIGLFLSSKEYSFSQELQPYGKNSFSFNLTRYAFTEINFGYERFISFRKSIEINGGLIYVNDKFEKETMNWKNAQAFSEHGYAGRFYYKVFRRVEDNTKKWRDYIAVGFSYRHLYYNEQWFDILQTDTLGIKYNERIFQKRERNKYGVEFLWGKVYEMNRTFALEFYYGGGVCATDVTRTIVLNQPDERNPEIIEVNSDIHSFYIRPYPMLGMKLRVRF